MFCHRMEYCFFPLRFLRLPPHQKQHTRTHAHSHFHSIPPFFHFYLRWFFTVIDEYFRLYFIHICGLFLLLFLLFIAVFRFVSSIWLVYYHWFVTPTDTMRPPSQHGTSTMRHRNGSATKWTNAEKKILWHLKCFDGVNDVFPMQWNNINVILSQCQRQRAQARAKSQYFILVLLYLVFVFADILCPRSQLSPHSLCHLLIQEVAAKQ